MYPRFYQTFLLYQDFQYKDTRVEAVNCPVTVKMFVEALNVRFDEAAKEPPPSLNCISCSEPAAPPKFAHAA